MLSLKWKLAKTLSSFPMKTGLSENIFNYSKCWDKKFFEQIQINTSTEKQQYAPSSLMSHNKRRFWKFPSCTFNSKSTNILLAFPPRNRDNCSKNFLKESRDGPEVLWAHSWQPTHKKQLIWYHCFSK